MTPVPRWSQDSEDSIVLGPPGLPSTEHVRLPADAAWLAPLLVRAHNAQVDAAGRPAVEVERMLTRVAVATVRELARGLLPRRRRR